MSVNDDILKGIEGLNTKLDIMSKINGRVIVLEENGKQNRIDIKDLKTNKASAREFTDLKKEVKATRSWWRDLVKNIAAVVIAAIIIGYMVNKSKGETNEKESSNSTSNTTSP